MVPRRMPIQGSKRLSSKGQYVQTAGCGNENLTAPTLQSLRSVGAVPFSGVSQNSLVAEAEKGSCRCYRNGAQMKHLALVVVLACATLPLAARGGSGDGAARSNILALEHAWDQALQRQDVKALAAIFDNALLYVDYDGTVMTKTEYLARVKSNGNHLQQVVTEEMFVQLFGNTAAVVGTYRETGTEHGKPYLRRGRFTDLWMLEGKNWICIASSATPILP